MMMPEKQIEFLSNEIERLKNDLIKRNELKKGFVMFAPGTYTSSIFNELQSKYLKLGYILSLEVNPRDFGTGVLINVDIAN